jgi:hypothetical protein
VHARAHIVERQAVFLTGFEDRHGVLAPLDHEVVTGGARVHHLEGPTHGELEIAGGDRHLVQFDLELGRQQAGSAAAWP